MAATFYERTPWAGRPEPRPAGFVFMFFDCVFIYAMAGILCFNIDTNVILRFPHVFPRHKEARAGKPRVSSSEGSSRAKTQAVRNPVSSEKNSSVL
ncbi:MAG: hypothetical protein LBS62_07730 [Clostridiales bacterium]|nr:hypothetical protein [Clostridiales bacterium]